MPSDPVAPWIFFSYAGEDAWWIELFRPHFSVVGAVRIQDYKADSVPYGPLGEALSEKMEASVVVIAFVSNHYRSKEWTVAEWEKGLDEAQRRRLIFVPIMLDADAVVWWQELRREERLTGLTRDYQYTDFTDGGEPAIIGPENPRTIQKIVKLALRIRDDLAAAPRTTPSNGSVEESTPSPEQKPAPPHQPEVVVLGHPSAGFPADLQEETRQLVSALGPQAVVSWGDGWRRKAAARAEIALEADPVFVQPIADTEAADHIHEKNKTNAYLTELGRPKARVALWLPARYRDAEFEHAIQTNAVREHTAEEVRNPKYPALRADTPEQLANWLRAEIAPPNIADAMVVQVEGLGTLEGVKPEIAVASKKIVDQLRDEIWEIVTRVVEKPRPASPAWQFWDSQFRKQIRILPGSRAIVAIHDLDIAPNPDRGTIRKRVESKFDKMYREVESEQAQRQAAGRPCLKLFLTALLINNADALPFSNYPDDGRYKDWRLLGFSPAPEPAANGPVPVRPDPASLAVFRTNLLAWAAAP